MPKKPNMHFRFFTASALILLTFLIANCTGLSSGYVSTSTASATPRRGDLTPFFLITATETIPQSSTATITPQPTITPTPRTHIVKKGEDLTGIALRYHVPLADLLAANPKVNPNMMSIGTVLVIPGAAQETPSNQATDVHSTPTAIPVNAGPVHCSANGAGGVWCTMLAENNQDRALEGLTAIFRLAAPQATLVQEQGAFLPLDVLHPGQSLPFTAYFPPPVPENYVTSAEIRSALPSADDGRYLPVRLENQQTILNETKLSAKVTLDIIVEGTHNPPKRVWIAATAYDPSGRVVGLRRWEKPSDQVITPGQAFPVSMFVYSNGGGIERIEIAAEARP